MRAPEASSQASTTSEVPITTSDGEGDNTPLKVSHAAAASQEEKHRRQEHPQPAGWTNPHQPCSETQNPSVSENFLNDLAMPPEALKPSPSF